MNYGVSNVAGKTSVYEVGQILAAARELGISVIDTASAYGDAETVIGEQDLSGFRLVTKSHGFVNSSITRADIDHFVKSFELSLARLRRPSVDSLLLHSVDNLGLPGCEHLIEKMEELKAKGAVQRIGVSVYERRQIELALDLFTPDLIQLPINVLDQRLIADGSLRQLKNSGIEIHARSALLQGLLMLPPASVNPYFRRWTSLIRDWHSFCEQHEVTPLQAALGFVNSLPEVDCVILGVETAKQLQECANSLSGGWMTDVSGLACDDPDLLNPSRWRLA